MQSRVDASVPFWTMVRHMLDGTYDDVTQTNEFEWFCYSIRRGVMFFMPEESFIPWCDVRDAMDDAGAGLPAGVTWNGADGIYEVDHVDGLFGGLGQLASMVVTHASCSHAVITRANDLVRCVKRMLNAVDVIDLTCDMKFSLNG